MSMVDDVCPVKGCNYPETMCEHFNNREMHERLFVRRQQLEALGWSEEDIKKQLEQEASK